MGGLKELARGIHMHPTVGSLWRHLCLFVLQFSPDHARVAANAAEVAALATPLDRKSLALATLGYLVAGRHHEALRCAQRSCFLYPDSVNNWCGLVGAAFPSCKGRGKDGRAESLKRILGFLRHYAKGKVEREVTAWLTRYDRNVDALIAQG